MPLALDLISTLVMGVDLAGCYHALGQIAFFHLGQLGGIDFGAAPSRSYADDHQRQNRNADDGYDDPTLFLFLPFATVASASGRIRSYSSVRLRLGSCSAI